MRVAAIEEVGAPVELGEDHMESFDVDVRWVQVVMEQTLAGDYWYVQGYGRNLFSVNQTHPCARISKKKKKKRNIGSPSASTELEHAKTNCLMCQPYIQH